LCDLFWLWRSGEQFVRAQAKGQIGNLQLYLVLYNVGKWFHLCGPGSLWSPPNWSPCQPSPSSSFIIAQQPEVTLLKDKSDHVIPVKSLAVASLSEQDLPHPPLFLPLTFSFTVCSMSLLAVFCQPCLGEAGPRALAFAVPSSGSQRYSKFTCLVILNISLTQRGLPYPLSLPLSAP
jgi:hypothetical protein